MKMRNLSFVLCLILIAGSNNQVLSQKNPALAGSPPMGWNSWNWFGKKDINENVVKEVIDAIASGGLSDAGYKYVIVDGGWRDVRLDSEGKLVAHPVKFPGGIKALADYAHSKGLKFGLHVVPGTHDCGGDPVGGFGKEELHVKQFVEWGLDFVKLDLCRQTEDPCTECEKTNSGWSEPLIKSTYEKWSWLLRNCGRDMVFSISAYRFRDWNPEICNMSRTTYDIQCRIHKGGAIFDKPDRSNKNYLSVIGAAINNNLSARYAGNGYWNDPDMMVTGSQGLTDAEQRSHFALWCIMSSPLFLGNDPRSMTAFEKNLITNKKMIAVNQDPTGQGYLLRESGFTQIWLKRMRNGKTALLFINLDKDAGHEVTFDISEAGFNKKVKVFDVTAGKNRGSSGKSISQKLEAHDCCMMILK